MIWARDSLPDYIEKLEQRESLTGENYPQNLVEVAADRIWNAQLRVVDEDALSTRRVHFAHPQSYGTVSAENVASLIRPAVTYVIYCAFCGN